MKILFTICCSLLLFSCDNRDKQIEELKQRISRLERIVDSFSIGGHVNSTITTNKIKNTSSAKPRSYSTPVSSGRCQAITKKGSQCKRKAGSNGYCWQHGG